MRRFRELLHFPRVTLPTSCPEPAQICNQFPLNMLHFTLYNLNERLTVFRSLFIYKSSIKVSFYSLKPVSLSFIIQQSPIHLKNPKQRGKHKNNSLRSVLVFIAASVISGGLRILHRVCFHSYCSPNTRTHVWICCRLG